MKQWKRWVREDLKGLGLFLVLAGGLLYAILFWFGYHLTYDNTILPGGNFWLVGGEILLVSQFTLLGDARHGRRPSFSNAARPEEANALYEAFCQALRAENIRVETGVFQTDMQVELVNDGPVTILLDSRKGF